MREMTESREERIVKNEALFRDVNERVHAVDRTFPERERADGLQPFICECANADCAERIELTPPEYERAREHPAQFIVVPGHIVPDVEKTVFRNDRFAVVEKHVGEQLIARERDPRREPS